ncbi:aldehyde dehydrogenase [Bacillus altitudinis]|uniref:aldehyde dehydrogenase n=1 Tax=Bacillus altitudinis TaxID=293387 RepID=UPI0012F14876|nr:aldehyde dehydrogenase [Bacillus altitudinis]MDM5164868.1 aldehyde dehydrogenase [Bacillus altitudinis]MED0682135.1 aldehyde dehydrogenase [Bacillus altitudinis]NMF13066.1 aldehyde dehydrogenase [Bacillus altitudinis]QOV49443.1 aldehyde dehydrogenase [Bacillus altitudinis]VXC16887.1 putative aldehyde dehydrogenase [Bacillus altitudinis]
MSKLTELIHKQKNVQTPAVQERIRLLNDLKKTIKHHEKDILQALAHDLHKSEQEAYTTEIGMVYEEINHTVKHLHKWAKPSRAKTPLTHIGSKSMIIKEPYGSVLIIAPWNYPFQLALSPLVGAISAGNAVTLKPSELTPHVSNVIGTIVESVFQEDLAAVVEGGVDVSTELLKLPFDYIFFTGSVAVGKVVMEAAAKHLTPVTLELGGKSPCIVMPDADIKLAAKRTTFGKFTNAGQTCIAPDYLLVHESIKEDLLREMTTCIRDFYGDQPETNPHFGKNVSQRHFDRLSQFLSNGTIVTGGQRNEQELKIAPTILDHITWEDPVMQEEIFGPILPVITFDSLQEAADMIKARPKPLALYLFTTNKETEAYILDNLSFGGGCINDTLMHVATPYLPFGGVGESGIGRYHGKESFFTFTHEKSVLRQTNRFDFSFRYPNAKNGLDIVRKFLK